MPDPDSSTAEDRTVTMCLLQRLSLSHVYMPPHIHYTDSAVWHACLSSLPDRLHTPQGSVLSPSYQSLFYCSITIIYKIKSHSSKFNITRTPSSCPVLMPEHLEQKDKWKQCLNYVRNKWYKKTLGLSLDNVQMIEWTEKWNQPADTVFLFNWEYWRDLDQWSILIGEIHSKQSLPGMVDAVSFSPLVCIPSESVALCTSIWLFHKLSYIVSAKSQALHLKPIYPVSYSNVWFRLLVDFYHLIDDWII